MTEVREAGFPGDAGAALEAGWRAFRAHPWALMAGQVVFLALGLWALLNLSLAAYVLAPRSRPVTAADWLPGLVLLLVGVLPWWLGWVGVAAAAQRAVRGERLTIGAFFTGLRHPLVTTWAGAVVHVALLGAMALAALPVVVATDWEGFRDGLDRLALLGGGQEMGRALVAELPPGYVASPGYHGDEQWFGRLDIEGGQASGLVEHSYTISSAVGTPY